MKLIFYSYCRVALMENISDRTLRANEHFAAAVINIEDFLEYEGSLVNGLKTCHI